METFVTGQAFHSAPRSGESRYKSLTTRVFRAAIQGLPGIHVHKPPVPHLLRSNAAPTDTEASLINLAIADAYLLYTRLHRILYESESRGNWQDRLQPRVITRYNFEFTTDFIEEQYVILSPVRKLPPEVLEVIFLGTLPPYLMDFSTRRRRNADLPWALSQVCQSWRATALSTPALWATLPTVNISADSTCGQDYLVFLLELLKRSQHIVLHIFVEKDGTLNDDFYLVLDILVAHSAKWKGLIIEAPFWIYALEDVKERLPELQWLYIRGSQLAEAQDPIRGPDIDIFQSAPKLRVARVDGKIDHRKAVLPYSQLTDYSQGIGHEHRLMEVFADPRPDLQRLSVRNFCESEIFRNMTRLITVSNLTTFEFEFAFESRSFKILGTFVLPVIEELKITTHVHGLIPVVSSLISRSQSSVLKKIYLRTKMISSGELTKLLKKAPTVEHINITIPPAQDITYLLHHPDVAPCLRTCGFFTDSKLPQKLVVALRSLAKSCCEDAADTVPDCNALYGVRRLQAVYLHSPFRYPPLEEKQRQLQGWNSTTWTSEYMKELRRGFLSKIPDIAIDYLRLPWARFPEKPRGLFRGKDPAKRLLFLTEELSVTKLADIYVRDPLLFHSTYSNAFDNIGLWYSSHTSNAKSSSEWKVSSSSGTNI